MRANEDYTSKDYVLGGTYNTTSISTAFIVDMQLVIRINDQSDFGIYKCIAKNAIGSSEEIIRVLRKFLFAISELKKLSLRDKKFYCKK
jgi:hypothetical protein